VRASSNGFTPCGGFWRKSRRLEGSDRPLVFAPRGEEKSAVTQDERAESRVTIRCASLDLREQPLCAAKVAGRQQSLDSSGARKPGEVTVEFPDLTVKRRNVPPARGAVIAGKLEDRECNPQAGGAPNKAACLDDAEQLGDRSARLLGVTPIGVDLGEDRQAQRLEHVQPDLTGDLNRLVAQLRGCVPSARRHLRLGPVEQAPDDVGIASLSGLGGQRSPKRARLVVALRPTEQ
jgi:hypothetical protein